MSFSDKVAIVTGGSQGIGSAYSTALLSIGMKVCICDVKEGSVKEFIEKLPEDKKNHVMFQKCDVTSFTDFKRVFEEVISHFGRIDVVVNNAGILDEHEWRKMIEVNIVGVVHGIQLAFQYMNINEGGHGGFVINTGSNAGFEAFEISPVYCGCKHAVNGLTKSYGTEHHFNKTGVKVSAVCPGQVETSLYRMFPKYCLDEGKANEMLNEGKPIKPEEVAKALIQVLRDGKNGALLRVDYKGPRYV